MPSFRSAVLLSAATIAALSIASGVVGCRRTLDPRRLSPRQPESLKALFDHDKHAKTIEQNNLNCLSCHPHKVALREFVDKDADLTVVTCHDCHRATGDGNWQPKVSMVGRAPQDCALCHSDLRPVKPADHFLNWRMRHALFARQPANRCATCHSERSCQECHLRRDSVRQKAHDRTFLHTHSVTARANPKSCGSCHRVDYCRDCHVGKGVNF